MHFMEKRIKPVILAINLHQFAYTLVNEITKRWKPQYLIRKCFIHELGKLILAINLTRYHLTLIWCNITSWQILIDRLIHTHELFLKVDLTSRLSIVCTTGCVNHQYYRSIKVAKFLFIAKLSFKLWEFSRLVLIDSYFIIRKGYH